MNNGDCNDWQRQDPPPPHPCYKHKALEPFLLFNVHSIVSIVLLHWLRPVLYTTGLNQLGFNNWTNLNWLYMVQSGLWNWGCSPNWLQLHLIKVQRLDWTRLLNTNTYGQHTSSPLELSTAGVSEGSLSFSEELGSKECGLEWSSSRVTVSWKMFALMEVEHMMSKTLVKSDHPLLQKGLPSGWLLTWSSQEEAECKVILAPVYPSIPIQRPPVSGRSLDRVSEIEKIQDNQHLHQWYVW